MHAGAQLFYDEFTLDGSATYQVMVRTFTTRYDSPTRVEENSVLLSSLTLQATRQEDDDDHADLKSLVERIEQLIPVVAVWDRGSEANSRILLQAVAPKLC